MKNIRYLFYLVICGTCIQLSFAQVVSQDVQDELQRIKSVFTEAEKQSITNAALSEQEKAVNAYKSYKTQDCSIDTSCYTTRLGELWGYKTHSLNGRDWLRSYGMGFKLAQTATIHGFRFYARAIRKKVNVRARLYIYQYGLPGTLIASKNVSIAVNNQLDEYVANFSSPVAISDSFYLTIEVIGFREVEIQFSVLGTGTLPTWGVYRQFGGWNNIESVFGVKWEPNFQPILDYDLTADFTVNGNTVNNGDTIYAAVGEQLVFNNTSSPILFNYMFAYRWINPGNPVAWDHGDGTTSFNTFSLTYQYDSMGTYQLILLDTMQGWTSMCTEQKSVIIKVSAASKVLNTVDIENTKTGVNIYPNPSKGEFQVELTDFDNQYAEVIINDIMGKIVYRDQLDISSMPKLKFNLSNYQKGFYFINIISENGMRSSRIVIE